MSREESIGEALLQFAANPTQDEETLISLDYATNPYTNYFYTYKCAGEKIGLAIPDTQFLRTLAASSLCSQIMVGLVTTQTR